MCRSNFFVDAKLATPQESARNLTFVDARYWPNRSVDYFKDMASKLTFKSGVFDPSSLIVTCVEFEILSMGA